MRIGFTVQKSLRAWMAFEQAAYLSLLAGSVFLYILFESEKKSCFVLNGGKQRFAPQQQSHHLWHEKGAVHKDADVLIAV